LLRDDEQITRLLWPPFDLTARDPGYIKAYPPGVRENGGQYSHAAAWLGWAFAQVGDGDTAMRVFRTINPIEHARNPEAVRRYRLEPYVVAADIASVEPHVGRGGWNWYTGAAAWCWRFAVEAILGLRRVGQGLRIEPHVPRGWPGFEATVRIDGGVLEIVVDSSRGSGEGGVEIFVDGSRIDGTLVPLPENGVTHQVTVQMRAHEDTSSGSEA
jgi:cyclic beta-1,2-glucan synthetase